MRLFSFHPLRFVSLVLCLGILTCCTKEKPEPSPVPSPTPPETVTDTDGNVYHTITLGTQTWLLENLKVTHFRNGVALSNLFDNTQWQNATTPAYCMYANDFSTASNFGLLYNWYAVSNFNNLAPKGWHVPNDAEWKTLEIYLGLTQTEADLEGWRGLDQGSRLKENGSLHWNEFNNGTNSSGFKAFGGGWRYSDGTFSDLQNKGFFWTSGSYDANTGYDRYLGSWTPCCGRGHDAKNIGFSVRCIKD